LPERVEKILPGFRMLSGSSACLICRIKLDRATELTRQEGLFALAYAVFAPCRCRPWQAPAALSRPTKASTLFDMRRILVVEDEADVEIAVARMADDRREEARVPRCRARCPPRSRPGARSVRRHPSRIAGPTGPQSPWPPSRRRAAPSRVSRAPPASALHWKVPPPHSAAIAPNSSDCRRTLSSLP
jgi:hypothetical protein